jgi:hypothetical protein
MQRVTLFPYKVSGRIEITKHLGLFLLFLSRNAYNVAEASSQTKLGYPDPRFLPCHER